MKKIKIALITVASAAVPAAAIAVPLSLAQGQREQIALTVPQGQTLSIAGDSVTINADVKSHKPVEWHHDNAPASIQFRAFSDCLQILATQSITEDTSFNIWGSVNGTASNTIRIFLVPQATSVETSFANGIDFLQNQESTVTIVATYVNKIGPTIWSWNTLPANVIVQSKTDNEIQFKTTKDVLTSGTFNVTATNNKISSSPLIVSLIPAITTVSLSYNNTDENPTHVLSFGGTKVVIKADVAHSNTSTTWSYTLPAGLDDGEVEVKENDDYITFKILDDNINVDQPSFLVRATNNTVTATINVYVQKVDQKDTIVVTSNINPSGIVWQNMTDYGNNPHIKTPAWQSGSRIYTPNFFDANGTPIPAGNVSNITWDYSSEGNPTTFIYSAPGDGTLSITWPEESYWTYDDPCVLRLNVSAEIEGITETVHNYVVVNIDFGTITGIKWKDHMEPPTELTGDSGSASFSAEVFGQGKLDQQWYDVVWMPIQPDEPLPPTLSISGVGKGLNYEDYTLTWQYTGLTDLDLNITVQAEAKDSNHSTIPHSIHMTFKQTTGISIKGESTVVTNLGQTGSSDYTVKYEGTSTDQKTEWKVEGGPAGAFTITSQTDNPDQPATLSWDPSKIAAADYKITITATSTANPAVNCSYPVTIHNRGVVTGINISGGTSTGPCSASVLGTNVDQEVTWSISASYQLSSGCSMQVFLTNITANAAFITYNADGYGTRIAVWTLTARSVQDNSVIKTVSGSLDASNWQP